MLNINYIKEYIEKSIQENWDQPAFSDYQGKTFLYKDVAMQIDRIHKIFDVWEIKQGDRMEQSSFQSLPILQPTIFIIL